MEKITCRDLVISQKTSKIYELHFTKDAISCSIEGWTIYFTVKKKMEDTDAQAVISKDITSHEDALAGKTLIELTATDTDLSGSYYYDIKYKTSDGYSGILLTGRITFKATVTTRG